MNSEGRRYRARLLLDLRHAAFLDDLEPHQVAQVPHCLLMVAAEDHPMQECHHAALDHVLAPVQEQPPGIGVGIVVRDKLVFAKGYGCRDYVLRRYGRCGRGRRGHLEH